MQRDPTKLEQIRSTIEDITWFLKHSFKSTSNIEITLTVSKEEIHHFSSLLLEEAKEVSIIHLDNMDLKNPRFTSMIFPSGAKLTLKDETEK